MRPIPLLLGLMGASLPALADRHQTVSIFVQPVVASQPEVAPTLLAEVAYDLSSSDSSSSAEITNYEAPDLPEDAELVRLYVADPRKGQRISSTTVTSVQNFDKGYSPHFTISVDGTGSEVLGVSLRGVRIDAGQTRDFGPQARVVAARTGKQPDLNRPVVLSPEGKKVVPEEKSFLQKYWWVLAVGVLLLTAGGGDQK